MSAPTGADLLALAWSLLVVVVPGMGAALAAYRPGAVGLPTRLSLVFGLGVAVAAMTAFVLSVLRVLHGATFFPVLGAVTVALWLAAARRGGLREHARALGEQIRGEPFTMGAGLLVILGIAVLRLSFPSVLHFSNSASWRYWADSLEVANAHRIPADSLQYGALYPPIVSKVVLNTLNAGVSFAVGKESLPGMWAMLWIGSVGMAVALWSVGRELGLRLTAALVPVLTIVNGLFLNPEMTVDLQNYKAEIFGRLMAFCALALAVRTLRRRKGWTDAALAGALFAVATGIHLIPVMVAGVSLACYAVARLIADRALGPVVVRAAVVAGLAGALGAVILILPHGDLGLRGAGGQTVSDFGGCFDPTLYLNSGVLPGHDCRPAGAWSLSPVRSLRVYTSSSSGIGSRGPLGRWIRPLEVLLIVGGLLAGIAVLLWFPRPLRATALSAWGLMVGIIGLTWFFSHLYHLYVPAWFGIRRLLDYSSIPLVLLALVLVEGGLFFLARARPWIPALGAALLTVVIAALVIPSAATGRSQRDFDQALVAPFGWIRAHVPCDARILADEHTEGAFEALTGRVAVLEGATPYLRPSIRDPIVRLILAARAFFHDPVGRRGFLEQQGVDYVVLIRGGVGYHDPIGTADRAALQSAPFLRLVYEAPAMTVYRVQGLVPSRRFADPRAAAYTCLRDPVAA